MILLCASDSSRFQQIFLRIINRIAWVNQKILDWIENRLFKGDYNYLFQKQVLSDPVDLRDIKRTTIEKFFQNQDHSPWLDRNDAYEQIETKLKEREISKEQAELCLQ